MLQIRLYALVGSLLLAATAGLFAFFSWTTYTPPSQSLAGAFPQAAEVAVSAAENFLDGRTVEFAVAADIEPDFRGGSGTAVALDHDELSAVSWRREDIAGRLVETHKFLVTTDGPDYILSVVVALDGEVPTLAAYPSLSPAFTDPGRPAAPLEYQDSQLAIDPATVAGPVKETVESWATAYVTNDLEALRVVVGDPTAQAGDYRGLGGFTLTDVELRSAVNTNNGLVLRVRLVMTSTSPNGARISNDFDLLVQGESTTLPTVVAWGQPGSGPTLERFQNRI